MVLVLAVAACGGGCSSSDGNSDGNIDPATRYEPWQVGASWSYKLTDPTGTLPTALNKKTTVMAMQDVGGVHAGKQAYLVHVEQMKGTKDVLEAPVGDVDVRFQTTFYDDAGVKTGVDVDQPYRLRLDESAAHTAKGAAWSETYTETSTTASGQTTTSTKTEQWQVINDAESVTVMAGTFTALHVRRSSNGGRIQDYWYVRGMGKVKETGGGQEEELMAYTPAP